MKEILQLQQENSANNFDINENNPELRQNQIKLEKVRQELENCKELVRNEEMKSNSYLAEFDAKKQEIEAMKKGSGLVPLSRITEYLASLPDYVPTDQFNNMDRMPYKAGVDEHDYRPTRKGGSPRFPQTGRIKTSLR